MEIGCATAINLLFDELGIDTNTADVIEQIYQSGIVGLTRYRQPNI